MENDCGEKIPYLTTIATKNCGQWEIRKIRILFETHFLKPIQQQGKCKWKCNFISLRFTLSIKISLSLKRLHCHIFTVEYGYGPATVWLFNFFELSSFFQILLTPDFAYKNDLLNFLLSSKIYSSLKLMILIGKFRLRYELYKNSSYCKMSFKILRF